LFKRKAKQQLVTFTGSAHGVGFTLEAADADVLALMRLLLPPAWREDEPGLQPLTLRLVRDADGMYELHRGRRVVTVGPQDEALDDLERQLRLHIALNAPDHFFLHAGAVSYAGAGVVLPGASFSGKTTLVAALVRAGATYYSDEHAVLGADGRLLPYPKPLGLRVTEGSGKQTSHDISALGGVSAQEAAPIRLVVVTQYRPGAEWTPTELSPADTVLALLQHTFRGMDQAERSIPMLRVAAAGAIGMKGDRGDARATATDLLARLTHAAADAAPAAGG
jgi:hypothetical protein